MLGQPESFRAPGSTEADAIVEHKASRPLQPAGGGSPTVLDGLLERCRDYLLLIANDEVPDDIRPKVAPSDLVQQSLAEAWVGIDKFRGDNEFELRAWLRRILLNNLHDTMRAFRETAKRGAQEFPLLTDGSLEGWDQQLANVDPSPSAHAAANEDLARVSAALDRLPSHYAQIVRLRNIEYLSFVEIGQRMQMSSDAVRKLWERAIKRLSNELSCDDVVD